MRPRGITYLAILEILLGLFALFGGVLHIFLRQGGFIVSGSVALSAIADILGDSLIIQGLILLLIGYGMWRGKGWAWSAALLFNVLGLITSVAAIALGAFGSLPALIANIIALYYLPKYSVKLYFRKTVTTT